MALPEFLKRYALKSQVTIGVKQKILVQDASAQTLALSASASIWIATSTLSGASPAIAGLPSPIVIPAGSLLLVEHLHGLIFEADASGKIKVVSCSFAPADGPDVQAKVLGTPIPYTFFTTSDDGFLATADAPHVED